MNPYNPNEVSHSGIPKQKWGVRRWQNPDGSLTPAGRERYRKLAQKRRKLQAKMDKLEPQNGERSEGTAQKKQGLTNDELRERTERARLEKDYYDAQAAMEASYSRLHPAKVSKGKEFVKKHGVALADKLASKAIDLAGDYALKKGKEWLGLDKKVKSAAELVSDLKNKETIRRYNDIERQVANLEKTKVSGNDPKIDERIAALRSNQWTLLNNPGNYGVAKERTSSDIVNDLKNNDVIRRYNDYEAKVANLEKTRTPQNSDSVDAQIDSIRDKQRTLFNNGGKKKDKDD